MPHLSFHLGPLEITGLGVMVALGAATGLRVFQKELAARFLADRAVDVGMAGVAGGLIGAKLFYVLEHVGREPVAAGLVSRGGMSWFGGVMGGALFALAVATALPLPLLPLVAAATPALALGQAFGRIGCFLVGDDYGRPSDLPWAVAFPEGLPPTIERVHPTQLYEAMFLALLAAAVWRWRRNLVPDWAIVARYCLLAGGFRFLLEFIRLNARVALGLTVAQWASLLLVAAGTALAWSSRPVANAQRRPRPRTGAS
jgi:phosphatidylglycerol---prolipoprotein diacylglyceryl transferase